MHATRGFLRYYPSNNHAMALRTPEGGRRAASASVCLSLASVLPVCALLLLLLQLQSLHAFAASVAYPTVYTAEAAAGAAGAPSFNVPFVEDAYLPASSSAGAAGASPSAYPHVEDAPLPALAGAAEASVPQQQAAASAGVYFQWIPEDQQQEYVHRRGRGTAGSGIGFRQVQGIKLTIAAVLLSLYLFYCRARSVASPEDKVTSRLQLAGLVAFVIGLLRIVISSFAAPFSRTAVPPGVKPPGTFRKVMAGFGLLGFAIVAVLVTVSMLIIVSSLTMSLLGGPLGFLVAGVLGGMIASMLLGQLQQQRRQQQPHPPLLLLLAAAATAASAERLFFYAAVSSSRGGGLASLHRTHRRVQGLNGESRGLLFLFDSGCRFVCLFVCIPPLCLAVWGSSSFAPQVSP
ncbi:hypothetical protein Efla_006210 [Eimeria flavescens]